MNEDEFVSLYMGLVDTALQIDKVNRFNMNQEAYINEINYAHHTYVALYEERLEHGMEEVMKLFDEFEEKRLCHFLKEVPLPREVFISRHSEKISSILIFSKFNEEDYWFIIDSEKYHAGKMFDGLAEQFKLYGYTNVVEDKLKELMMQYKENRYPNLYKYYEKEI